MLVEPAGLSLLSWFGLIAAVLMLLAYMLEELSHHFVLGLAGACVLGAIYEFLVGAWPFGIVLSLWALVAYWRWHRRHRAARQLPPPPPS